MTQSGHPRKYRVDLARRALFNAGWVQRVRVHHRVSNGGVFGCLLGHIHQASHRTTADAAGGATHAARHLRCVMSVSFFEMLLKKNRRINRMAVVHGVEPAAMNESCTAGLSNRVDAFEKLRHPLRFTGEVAVVKPVPSVAHASITGVPYRAYGPTVLISVRVCWP